MSTQGAPQYFHTQWSSGSSNDRNRPTPSVSSATQPPSPPSSGSDELRLVLLGKTGAGKSATGNTILGNKCFNDDLSMSSVTKECQRESAKVEGRNLVLVDTPGFFDTDLTEQEIQQEVISCLHLTSPGPHAFLVVIPIERYTEEQQRTVEKILEMFKEDISRYSILIFSHADRLEGRSIETFISRQGQKIKELVTRFGRRFVAFNNKNSKNRDQVRRLLQKVDELLIENENRHFSNEITQVMLEAQKIIEDQIKQEVRKTADDRWSAFTESLNKERQETDRRKTSTQNKIDQIKADIQKEDRKLRQLTVDLKKETDRLRRLLEREEVEEEDRMNREVQASNNLSIWIKEEEQRRLGGEEGHQNPLFSEKYRKLLAMLCMFLMGIGTGYAPALLAFLFPAAQVAEAGLAAQILTKVLALGSGGLGFKAAVGAAKLALMTQCTIQ